MARTSTSVDATRDAPSDMNATKSTRWSYGTESNDTKSMLSVCLG